MTSMSAREWDDRYRRTDLVWSATSNRWVAEETANLTPGRALDLACGEGRNSIFLAQCGWDVTSVDFSSEGVAKSHRLALAQQPSVTIDWRCADATQFDEPTSYVIAHHSDNLEAGVPGPQDPAVLYTQDDVVADLTACGAQSTAQRAESVERRIEGYDHAALDTPVRVTKA